MGSFSKSSWCESSRRFRARVGQAYREFVETEKEKETWETCMGEAFLMPHTECAHRQAQTQTSVKPWALQRPPQGSVCYRRSRGFRRAAYTQPRLRHRRGFYYTSQSLSTVWSSVSECQQQHVLSLSFHFSCHCRSRSSRYLYSKVKPSFFRWPHFS